MSVTSPARAGNPSNVDGRRPALNRWLVLAIVCVGQFMVVLDATVVNVALPTIKDSLGFSDADLQWVINAYALVFGGFLLLGGRASDLLGRRRLFAIGVAIFTVASLINGFAGSAGVMVAGRALQGFGGALVSPAALSMVTTTFTDPKERTRALGVWSAIAASGAAFGFLLGGILTEYLSWSWAFYVNVPVGIAAIIAALRFVPESRGELRHRSFDVAGAVTVTGGLMVLVFAIVRAQVWGWGSGRTIGLGLLALALLASFVVIETRSRFPLMRLRIFAQRTLSVANLVMLLVASGMFSMFFFVSLFAQDVLGYHPLKAGLAFLPVSAGIVFGAGLSQGLIRKLGLRVVPVIGLVVATGGLVVLTRLPVDGSYVSDLLSGMLPLSIGMGLTFMPVTLLATNGVAASDAGLASGLLNTMQQIGGALGLAILSTVAASRTTHALASAHRPPTAAIAAHAEVTGFHAAFLGSVIAMLAAAVILLVVLRHRDVKDFHADAEAVPVA